MNTTSAELEELIDATVSIPTIPTTLMEINRVVAADDGSAREAGEVIERDPAIATKVLRLVNSSFYALRNPISAIGLACSMLGLKVIKNIVVQASVLDGLGTDARVEGFEADWLWDHSFKTALAARRLAEAAGPDVGIDKADAYTCGLVHDIGKMVLLGSQPQKFGRAVVLSRGSKIPLAQAENQVFGFSHAQVGGLLAERWKLSPALQTALLYHHAPADEPDDGRKGLLIQCANTIAHQVAQSGYVPGLAGDEAFEQLGVGEDAVAAIREEVRTQGIQE